MAVSPKLHAESTIALHDIQVITSLLYTIYINIAEYQPMWLSILKIHMELTKVLSWFQAGWIADVHQSVSQVRGLPAGSVSSY